MKTLQFAVLSSLALGAAFSTSCATSKGFGQDLQKVGNRIENRADSTGGAAAPASTGLTYPETNPGVPDAY